MTQARQPALFAGTGVEDTPEGRSEMIILHLFLVLERLGGEGPPGTRLGRLTAEAFVTDVDDSLREMGVGDLAVPRKVKRAAAGLYQRCHGYRLALEAGADCKLAAELAGSVPGLGAGSQEALRLASYVRRSKEHLERLAPAQMLAGRVTFPAADAIVSRACDKGVP